MIRVSVVLAVAIVFWLTGCMERYFYYPTVERTPAPRLFNGAEDVWFNSADGTRLHGWFIPAQSPTSSKDNPNTDTPSGSDHHPPAPTILHVHGNAGSINSHLGFTDYLPSAGFNLFIFDYRGYGESEGKPHSRGPLIADANAALDAILKRNDVDPQRIALYGQSLGGAIALNVMAQRQEIKAAVIESGFASWREMAAIAVGGEHPNWLARILAAVLIPDANRPDVAIAKVNRPILLLHGTADSVIPISQSRELAAAAGEHATFIEIPGGDHNSLRETNPKIEKAVIDFLREKFAAPEPAE